MASTQATIDLVVRGSNAVNKLIQDVNQLQSAVNKINSRTLDVASATISRTASEINNRLRGIGTAQDPRPDVARRITQLTRQQEGATEGLATARRRLARASDEAARAEDQLIERSQRRTKADSQAQRDIENRLNRNRAAASAAADEIGQLSARLRSVAREFTAIQRTSAQIAIPETGRLIDTNQVAATQRAIRVLAEEFNRLGDSAQFSAEENRLSRTDLPRQTGEFNRLSEQLGETRARAQALRAELVAIGRNERLAQAPAVSSIILGEGQSAAQMLQALRDQPSEANINRENQAILQRNQVRQGRRSELRTQINEATAAIGQLEAQAMAAGQAVLGLQDRYADLVEFRQRDQPRTGLNISLNQIQAQAESLALVANNSAIASNAFRQYTVAAEVASIKLGRAQQETFTALAAGFSGGGGVNIPQGLRQEASIAGARNMVGQLISDIPNLTRSEGALNAHIQLLSQIRTILPFLSLEYRAVEEAIAGLSQELEGVGLRGQTSKIDPGAGQRLLKQREREDKIAQNRATAIDKVYQEQLGLTDRIASSKLFVADKEDLSLKLNYALDALGESQLENAVAMTRQIADQLKLKEKLVKLSLQGRGEQKVFGTLGTSFLPITGELPPTVSATGQKARNLVPGSPAARLEEASANEKSTKAAVALAKQKLQAVENEAEELRKGTAAATALGKQKLKALEDEAKRLRGETSAAVALAQQRSKEQERMIADAWKLSGGPALPPWMQSGQKVFGTLGTSFMPVSGQMPKGRSQLQAEEAQKASREIAAQQIVVNRLQKQYTLEEGKGVQLLQEKVQLNGLLDTLAKGQVTSTKANSAAIGQNIKYFRDMLALRVLEARVAGTYQGGGGKKATTAEQLEDRRGRLLERALGVQGTAIALEARGAQVAQEKQEIEATILRLKQLQGQASEDDLKILLKKIQNLKIASKEISNALPPTQKGRTTDKTPFLEKLTGSPRASAAISEGLIGGAFPLLFGQGIGASAGGLIGGATGGFAGGGLGFGLSLIGTALGSVFDTLNQAAQDTGKAFNYPIEGFEKLKAAGLFASRQQEYYISKLIETGQTSKATAEIQAEMIKKIGVSGVNDLADLGDASSKLSKAWAEFNLQLQAALAGPMAGLLEWVAGIVAIGNGLGRDAAFVKGVESGLTGKDLEQFRAEKSGIRGLTRRGLAFGGITLEEASKREKALAQRFSGRSAQEVRGAKQDPAQQIADLDKAIERADKARSLVQQGVALERSGVDLRLNVEDTVYGLRKRATDMEREAAEFRRSVEDQVFGKRQELEQKLIENERKRQQNAIDAFDLQLQKASTGLDPIAQGVVDAARDYLRIRAEGEANLQQAEKQLKLELQRIDQEVNRYRLQVEDRVSQMAIQRDEFSRDVSRARLQIERQIGDYVVQVEEYRLQMAKHRYEVEIDLERKKQIAAQSGLTGGGGPVDRLVGSTGQREAFVQAELVRRGFTPEQTAATMGSIRQESTFNPYAQEPGGTGLGLFQWSFGRRGKVPAFTGSWQKDIANQLDLFQEELNTTEKKAGQMLMGATTLQGAAAGMKQFERYGEAGSRYDYMQDYYKRFTGGAGAPVVPATQAASAGASTRTAPGAMGAAGAAPVFKGVLTMPALPSAPQLVGINDLMQQYLGIIEQIKEATASASAVDRQALAIRSEAARLAFEQQALAPVLQYKEQNRELEFEIQRRKERNRLALEGFAPEIIEGEMRVLEIQRDLNSVLSGLEISTNQVVKAELERLNLNPQLVDSAFSLTEATLASLVATTEDAKKQEELRAKLQAILDLRNKLAKKIEGEAGSAVKGARGAAEASVMSPREKIEGRIGKLKEELAELTNVGNIAISVADGIGNAFGQAFQGLISGSASAQEALSSFFKSVAESFLSMAAEIIAKQMTMIVLQTILKALGAAASASSVGSSATNFGGAPGVSFNPASFSMPALAANGATFANGIAQFARGGTFTNSIVSSPTLFQFADGGVTRMGEMGEAGPEAIMPLRRGPDGRLGVDASGMAVPYRRPAAAAATPEMEVPYQRGGSALAVPYLKSEGNAVDDSMNATIDVKFETVRIGGVDYVTRDEAEQIGRESAQRGADLAHKRYRNSPSARRAAGMS